MKIFVAILWVLITSVLVKYSLLLGFNHDSGISGSIVISFTILWLYAFFKNPNKGK